MKRKVLVEPRCESCKDAIYGGLIACIMVNGVKSTIRKLKLGVVCDYNLSTMANKEPSTSEPNIESIRASGSNSTREPSPKFHSHQMHHPVSSLSTIRAC